MFFQRARTGNGRLQDTRRVLCVSSHPTQFDPPLWRALAARGVLEPTVWYLRAGPPVDDEIGQPVAWATPVAGYSSAVVAAGDVLDRLRSGAIRPDVICVPGYRLALNRALIRYARRNGIPAILLTDAIGLPEANLRALARGLLHAAGCRLFSGFWTSGTLARDYLESLGVPRDRIALGLYPVDVKLWRRRLEAARDASAQLRQSVGAGPGDHVVLAVSKLAGRENPLLILDAFALLHAAQPGSHLVFAGDGPLRDSVIEHVQASGLAASVHLMGYVPYADLPLYYGAADVFVHVPQVGSWELSLGEAMACGVPVVSHRHIGAAVDLIQDYRTGFFANPDPRDVADKLLLALQHELKTNAREGILQAVKTHADVDAACPELEGLMRRLGRPPVFETLLRSAARQFRATALPKPLAVEQRPAERHRHA